MPFKSIWKLLHLGTVITLALLRPASNWYIPKVGGQSTMQSPGSKKQRINKSISSSQPHPICITDCLSLPMPRHSNQKHKSQYTLGKQCTNMTYQLHSSTVVSSATCWGRCSPRETPCPRLSIFPGPFSIFWTLDLGRCLGIAFVPKPAQLAEEGHKDFHWHPTLWFPKGFFPASPKVPRRVVWVCKAAWSAREGAAGELEQHLCRFLPPRLHCTFWDLPLFDAWATDIARVRSSLRLSW